MVAGTGCQALAVKQEACAQDDKVLTQQQQQEGLATLQRAAGGSCRSSSSVGSESSAFSGPSRSCSEDDRSTGKKTKRVWTGDDLCRAFLAPCCFESDDGSIGSSNGDGKDGAELCFPQDPFNVKTDGLLEDCNLFDSGDSLTDTDFGVSFDEMLSPRRADFSARLEDMSGLRRVFSETLTGSATDDAEDRKNKKLKVEWTRDLHERFVKAVDGLGADKAVPSKIKERMGEAAAGLTRQNIASHLQKYRNRKRNGLSSMGCKSMSTEHMPPLLPAGMGGMPSGMPFWTPVMPLFPIQGNASSGSPAAPHPMMMRACNPGSSWQGGFVPMLPSSPQQQSVPVRPAATGPAAASAAAPAAVCLGQRIQPPAADEINQAISQILRSPKLRPPLGLKLDAGSVLQALNAQAAPVTAMAAQQTK